MVQAGAGVSDQPLMGALRLSLVIAALSLTAPATAAAHGSAHLRRVGNSGLLTHGPDRAPRETARASSVARFSQAAATWCGEVIAADDKVHEPNQAAYRFHVVYALPSDGQNRLPAVAAGLQADARQASSFMAARFGRAVAFDNGTKCGPQYLDITTIRLPVDTQTLNRLAGTSSGVIAVVADALKAAGLPVAEVGEEPTGEAARTNYLVWLDGPEPDQYCGQATLSLDRRRRQDNENNFGGKVAAIFRDGEGFCGPSTVLHEIGHTLGAVQPRSAGDGNWTGHCSDEAEDVMCDASAPALGDPGAARDRLDTANDDYWDPSSGPALGWWTLNLSRFICPDTSCKPTAAVTLKKPARVRKARSSKRRLSAREARRRAYAASRRRRAAAARKG